MSKPRILGLAVAFTLAGCASAWAAAGAPNPFATPQNLNVLRAQGKAVAGRVIAVNPNAAAASPPPNLLVLQAEGKVMAGKVIAVNPNGSVPGGPAVPAPPMPLAGN